MTYVTMLGGEMFIFRARGLQPSNCILLIPQAPDVANQCVNLCGRVFVYDHMSEPVKRVCMNSRCVGANIIWCVCMCASFSVLILARPICWPCW